MPVEGGRRRLCALVVDDSHDAAQSFAMVLIAMGWDAAFVIDSRDALAKAMSLRPNIAFLDIGMPHLNGYDVARLLRANFNEDELKLVAVTAYGEARDRAESRRAGFDAHVLKPVDPLLVESILKTVLPDS